MVYAIKFDRSSLAFNLRETMSDTDRKKCQPPTMISKAEHCAAGSTNKGTADESISKISAFKHIQVKIEHYNLSLSTYTSSLII